MQWLWGHQRWKLPERPENRFRPVPEKDYTATDLLLRGWVRMPKSSRVVFQLPPEAAVQRALLTRLPRIQSARPDLSLIILVPEETAGAWLDPVGADEIVIWPHSATLQKDLIAGLRRRGVDTWLSFERDWRAGWIARRAGAWQRIGVCPPDEHRWFLNARWKPGRDEWQGQWDEASVEALLQRFGLPATTPKEP